MDWKQLGAAALRALLPLISQLAAEGVALLEAKVSGSKPTDSTAK